MNTAALWTGPISFMQIASKRTKVPTCLRTFDGWRSASLSADVTLQQHRPLLREVLSSGLQWIRPDSTCAICGGHPGAAAGENDTRICQEDHFQLWGYGHTHFIAGR